MATPGASQRRPARLTLALAAFALLVGIGAGCPSEDRADSASTWQAQVEGWRYPDPIPDLSLVDQDGRPYSLHQPPGSYLLMGFIFTRCRVGEACPTTTARMAQTLERWRARAGEAPGARLHLLSVTLDPAWDTPERLRAYARAHGADPGAWTFATGPAALMTDGLPSLFNVLALPSAEAGITHTVKVALLRPDRTTAAEWKDDAFRPEVAIAALISDAGGGE